MGSSLNFQRSEDENEAIIKCQTTKNTFKFNTSIPPSFVSRIEEQTWKECMKHTFEAVALMDSYQIRRNSKTAKRCAIVCLLIFCSCLPSAIIAILSALTTHLMKFYIAASVLFTLSAASMLLFSKYLRDKSKYDHMWRMNVYNGIKARFYYLNNHLLILKQHISFRLENTINAHQWTKKCPNIVVTLKTKTFSLPSRTVYNFQKEQPHQARIAETYDILRQPLLSNDALNDIPEASAPYLSPNHPETKPKYPFNPELLNDSAA